jgi:hypothetical protein
MIVNSRLGKVMHIVCASDPDNSNLNMIAPAPSSGCVTSS